MLSPFLYDIFTANIAEDLPHNIRIIQFADDIAIYTRGINRKTNKESLTEALRILDNNLSDIGLQLEPTKTIVIEFNKNGFVNKDMDIEFNGKILKNIPATRFLRIILDNQLKFNNHVDYIRGKIEKANNVLKYISSITKGPEINTSLILYKSLVRSVSDYGCFIYAPLSKITSMKLERGQFLGLRTALGLRNPHQRDYRRI